MQRSCNVCKYVFLCFLFTSSFLVNACTIFMANDGQNVWIGNNEDELQQMNYRTWFYPAKKNHFGYVIWTELSMGKLFNGFSYLNPQGGLNEFGLFMDFTAIDKISIVKDDQKKDRKRLVVTDILKKCKTVEEALTYLDQFNLIKLNRAQLFIADATGNYATVTGAYIIRKTEPNFALTNYCLQNGHQEACHRRDVATRYLKSGTTFELNDIKNILEKSTQKLPNNLVSNYSMAVNLKTSTIYLYYKNDFTTVTVLSLAAELKKGKHHTDLADYFPKSMVPVLEKEYSRNGIQSAITRYASLRISSFDKYNFTNDEVMHLAISWIEKNKTSDAILLLECLKRFDPQKAIIHSWLGVAYRKENKLDESNKNITKALEIDPGDYVAILYGKQQHLMVTFTLPDFEAAEKVALMGDFTEWTKHPIYLKKEKGTWTCEVALPKGEVIYKFIVNDQYLADNKNFLHIGKGADVYSKLYVW